MRGDGELPELDREVGLRGRFGTIFEDLKKLDIVLTRKILYTNGKQGFEGIH